MKMIPQIAIGLLVIAAGFSQQAIAQVQPTSLQELPTGEYYYQRLSASGRPSRAYVLLRKVGRTVIGLDARSPNQYACFRGFIEGDRIVDATRVLPPYQPDSQWQHRQGVMLDLASYQRVPVSLEANPIVSNPISPDNRAALQTCIESFWR